MPVSGAHGPPFSLSWNGVPRPECPPTGSPGVSPEAAAAAAEYPIPRPEKPSPTVPVQVTLLAVAGWLAWRPAETSPWSAVVLASLVLVLSAWGWRRTSSSTRNALAWTAAFIATTAALGLAGHDPAAASAEAMLVVAVAALIWLGSREAPPENWPAILGLVLSGLAVWGLLQVTAGPEYAAAILAELPEPLRAAATERLASGRAFASQPLPSHLAVLLATALPILLARLKRHRSALPWAAGAVLCVVGLAATRSPIGIALALGACLALAVARGGRALKASLILLTGVMVLVVAARGDVHELEPVRLRLENWRTAAWVWSTAPAAGVGLGGFGQAAQAVPFDVGNRPRHAHSLPLEWLAELGPVGLMISLAAFLALARLVRDLWRRRPDLAVAVLVVPFHNLVDVSLFGTGVALPWAVLVGWALAVRGPVTEPGSGPRGRTLMVAAASLGFLAAVLHATSVTVQDSAASQTRAEERFNGAKTAQRLAPWRTEPLEQMAVAALESHDPGFIAAAAVKLEKARWLRPGSAALADLRGLLARARGRAPTAVAEAWAAQRAHPENPVYRQRYEQLLGQLQGQDSGAGN